MNTNSKTGPGVREDHRTGQFVPTVDGKDESPTSFDRDRAMTIAQGHWLTKTQAQPAPAQTQPPRVAHTPTPWKLSGNLIYDGYGHKVLAKACSLADFNEQDANGAFIVQAVNSHQALIDALKECITEDGALAWRNARFAGQRLEAISNIARAALSLAKGEAV